MTIVDVLKLLRKYLAQGFLKHAKIYDYENPEFAVSELYYDPHLDKIFIKFKEV